MSNRQMRRAAKAARRKETPMQPTPEQVQMMLESARRNAEQLRGCEGHRFRRNDPQPMKYRCLECGGIVSAEYLSGYRAGLLHGGSPVDPALVVVEEAPITAASAS